MPIRSALRGALAILLAATLNSVAQGQGTGEFLCSAGTRDELPCESDLDCPAGVCVIAQGVCDGGTDDGLTCDCPAGTCVETPVCSIDESFGTCAGGTSAGLCCDVSFNCSDGTPCVGTAQICVGGVFAGFACLRDDHCDDSTCGSSGRYCLGGDFESYSCNVDGDCPNGSCTGVPLPTQTPTTPVVTATPATPVPTSTPVPTATTGPGETPAATSTPVPTSTSRPTSTPAPTRTATADTRPGEPAVVATAAPAGTARLFLVDGEGLPVEGVVLVGDESIEFTRRISGSLSNRLDLRTELSNAVTAGTVVRLIAFTPTPHAGQVISAEGDAACTVVPTRSNSVLPLVLLGLAGVLVRPRRPQA